MREASNESSGSTNIASHSQVFNMMSARSSMSIVSNSKPITRDSLAVLTGDADDLLSESPVFQNAKGVGENKPNRQTISEPI